MHGQVGQPGRGQSQSIEVAAKVGQSAVELDKAQDYFTQTVLLNTP